MRYIRLYNKAPKPVKWTYRNVTHRIGTAKRGATLVAKLEARGTVGEALRSDNIT
jgi:hypothetical protein